MMISVIIPTYKSDWRLERAIKSVVLQEGNHKFEILLCEDGEVDQNIKDIAKLYKEVKILPNPSPRTGGPNAGKNRGIKSARGKYICFLDQDDEWVLNKINRQLKEMENGAEIVGSNSTVRV